MESDNNELYSRPVLEFVTMGAEFCKTLESCSKMTRARFVDVMCGLLPMVYLKATLLPAFHETAGYNAPCVTEEDYNYVRNNVAAVMGEEDDFLDVFTEDFKYSDQPVRCTISENLADMYQSLRDFVEVVRAGYDEAVEAALHDIQSQFETSWGQKAVNALRALHDIRMKLKYGA